MIWEIEEDENGFCFVCECGEVGEYQGTYEDAEADARNHEVDHY